MIVVLAGENGFGLLRELRRITDEFVAAHGDIAVERLDGEEASFERIRESSQSLPFLADKKLVILRSPSANKQFISEIDSILNGLPETTDLVIVEPKPDKRSTYYKILKKQAELREFPSLDEQALAAWLAGAAEQAGGTLSRPDARFLVERVGNDQQLISGELDKLLAYSVNITRASIELLVEPAPQSKIFDLLEVAFARDIKKAMDLYRDQREQKVDPAQIISMLAWQLKVVALVKAAAGRSANDIARDAKLSPFTVQKSQAIARGLSMDSLKRLVAGLLVIDARSKRENIDLDEALQNYLLSLAT